MFFCLVLRSSSSSFSSPAARKFYFVQHGTIAGKFSCRMKNVAAEERKTEMVTAVENVITGNDGAPVTLLDQDHGLGQRNGHEIEEKIWIEMIAIEKDEIEAVNAIATGIDTSGPDRGVAIGGKFNFLLRHENELLY